MKRPVFIRNLLPAILCMVYVSAFSHATDSLAVYKKFPFVPSFQLIRADSSVFFMKDVIPKKQACVVIVFSPGCSHCRHQAEEITSHIQLFNDVHFLFATPYPVNEMKQYISDYALDKFPNISVGHDKGMNLQSFYKIRGLPGIFVYNNKGKLVSEYFSNIPATTLADDVKKQIVLQ